jgi:hypothetical protein
MFLLLLLALLFDPEDGGDMLIQNVGVSLNYNLCNQEDRTIQSHRQKNIKSSIANGKLVPVSLNAFFFLW